MQSITNKTIPKFINQKQVFLTVIFKLQKALYMCKKLNQPDFLIWNILYGAFNNNSACSNVHK